MTETLDEYKRRVASAGGRACWARRTEAVERAEHMRRVRAGGMSRTLYRVIPAGDGWAVEIQSATTTAATLPFPTRTAARRAMAEMRTKDLFAA